MTTGLIRLMGGDTSRYLARRKSPAPVSCAGTAFPGPALTSGPGTFLSDWRLIIYAVAGSDPAISSFHSYLMRRESGWPQAGRKI